MPRLFRTRFRDYQLLDSFEAQNQTTAMEFFNINTARSFVQSLQDDYFANSALRDLVAERYYHSDIHCWSDHQVLEFVAGKLASGQIRVASEPIKKIPATGSSVSPAAAEVVEPPPAQPVVSEEALPRLQLAIEIEPPPKIELAINI